MATQQTQNPGKTILGKRPANAKARALGGVDEFAESGFYTPVANSEDAEKLEFMLPWGVGETLIGKLHSIRTANKSKGEAEQYEYACLETTDGVKFRVKSPGQLSYLLRESVKIGDIVEMTYNGKDTSNPKFKKGVHSFSLNVLEIQQ